jgi:23S rRNA (uracil1939-C5)-methyltransferase
LSAPFIHVAWTFPGGQGRTGFPPPQVLLSVSTAEDLTIESVGARGDGVAAGPVHVPFTLPGERVRAEPDGERARLVEVLSASTDRAAPPCPHFGACGGCALQHWAPQPYLAWKRDQVAAALARERLEPEILPTFASPPASRRRLAMHARQGRRDEARLGYKMRGSWTLVDIEVCPIADPRLQAMIPALRRLAAPFLEHPKSAPTLHVTWTLTGVDVDVTGVERRRGGLSADARMRAAEAAAAMDAARVTMSGEVVYGARQPVVKLGPAVVALPPGAFLQATPQAEAAMAVFAVEAVDGAKRVADLYCGVGTFTFRLAEHASVLAVDGDAAAIRSLNAAAGATTGLRQIAAEARDLMRRPLAAEELNRCDAAVFDPPRAGAPDQCREIARSKLARVVGVSCNPATFARDARVLADAGFTLERVLPVDQFLWSPHVELVGVFSR